MTGEAQDILDKVKKYGNMKVVITQVQTDLPHLYPMYSAEMAELLSEIQEDLEELVQKIVRPKELL